MVHVLIYSFPTLTIVWHVVFITFTAVVPMNFNTMEYTVISQQALSQMPFTYQTQDGKQQADTICTWMQFSYKLSADKSQTFQM